jgi:hypothetical protein
MHGLIETENADALLRRMRCGDRDAAAAVMGTMGRRLRRRLGSKLGPEIRRVLDSSDVLSTVVRRLDRVVLSGRLRATTAGELWVFLCVLGDRAVTEKCRRLRTERARRPAWVASVASDERASPVEERGIRIDLDVLLSRTRDPIDREILVLWLAGRQLRHIAGVVGLAPTAVRKRWQTMRARLKAELLSGES